MKILAKLVFLASLALGTLAFAAPTPSEEAPDVLIKRITMEVLDAARTDKAIKAGDRRRIHQLVDNLILPHVDFERTTALTLGRHWREATPQQRTQLTEEFRALLMYTYAGALSQVGDQKVVFRPLRAEPGATEVEVRFDVLQPRNPDPVQVTYRVYKTPDGWKVYDVNVLGVWLIETYKESFSAEIGRDGIDGLIRTLSEKNKRLAEQPPQDTKAS